MSSNKLGKIINIFLDIILVPIFILTLICFVSATSAKRQNKVPTVFGYSVVTVLTGSMEPEYPARSVVVLKSIKAEDVKVGDIIAFYGGDGRENDMVIFHRVIAIEPSVLVAIAVCPLGNEYPPAVFIADAKGLILSSKIQGR